MVACWRVEIRLSQPGNLTDHVSLLNVSCCTIHAVSEWVVQAWSRPSQYHFNLAPTVTMVFNRADWAFTSRDRSRHVERHTDTEHRGLLTYGCPLHGGRWSEGPITVEATTVVHYGKSFHYRSTRVYKIITQETMYKKHNIKRSNTNYRKIEYSIMVTFRQLIMHKSLK